MGNIDQLLTDKNRENVHELMAKGSLLAGLAFSNTRTTACHSISYPLTMQYHIPHGVAVSLLLGPVLKRNLPFIQDPGKLFQAFGVKEEQEIETCIRALLSRCGYPLCLRDWGAFEEDLPLLVSHSITKGRADNNPAKLTEQMVYDILKTIF